MMKVERQGENWTYSIDFSNAPKYAISTIQRVVTYEMAVSYFQDLDQIMSQAMNEDKHLCPYLLDLNPITFIKIGIMEHRQARTFLSHQLNQIIVASQSQHCERSVIQAYILFLKKAASKVHTVETIEQAIQLLER